MKPRGAARLLRLTAWHFTRVAITLLIGGLLGATLVRLAPGYGVTDADFDPRLSGDAVARSHVQREPSLPQFYAQYLAGLAHGDLGWSTSLSCPIADLVRARLPLSIATLARGVTLAVLVGLVAALIGLRWRALSLVPSAAAIVCVSVPAAVIALLLLIRGWPGTWALAAAVFPHVYSYSRNLVEDAATAPHVVAAYARGIRPARVILNHVLRTAAPQMLAVIGLAVSIGFPALVPIEVVCDSPGLLQLAWNAALARDMPVLVNITLLAAVVVMIGNAASDVLSQTARSTER
jgi:ABC-type dipeptide/oligopeptide/nickel transport system permease component